LCTEEQYIHFIANNKDIIDSQQYQ